MTSAVCVYCGSSTGTDPSLAGAAAELGTTIARAGLGLVYGGGAVGLMGIAADAALAAGGNVIGVIPSRLFSREIGHTGLTELHEVDSMHARKQMMFDLSSAFVGFPGGLGTLEELAEILTWAQLGMHRKPIVLLDLDGFWQPLLHQFDTMVDAGLLKPENRALVASVERVGDVLDAIASYRTPTVEKWIGPEET